MIGAYLQKRGFEWSVSSEGWVEEGEESKPPCSVCKPPGKLYFPSPLEEGGLVGVSHVELLCYNTPPL